MRCRFEKSLSNYFNATSTCTMFPSYPMIPSQTLSCSLHQCSQIPNQRNPRISPPKRCWRSFRCICEPEVQAGAETIPNTLNLTQRKLVEFLEKLSAYILATWQRLYMETVQPIDESFNLCTTVGAHNAAEGKFSMVQAVTDTENHVLS